MKMNRITLLGAGLLMLLGSVSFVVAEEHAAAALDHANQAVIHGKAGHASVLVEHATEALKHARAASEVAKGESKTHIDAAVKSLETSIEHGKMGTGHEPQATKAAEEAVEHLKAGNK
jgi:hypothetical protein